MGGRHIFQIVFPVTFWKPDFLQGESIKVFLRRVSGQMRLEDVGTEEEGLLQFTSDQFLFRPIRGNSIGMIVHGDAREVGPPIGLLRPSGQG